MPTDLSSYIDPTKYNNLLAIKRPAVQEYLAIYWPPPNQTAYYGSTYLPELSNYTSFKLEPFEARLPGNRFLEVPFTSDIGDETVPLQLANLDQRISQLYQDSGEGVKVEVFYYFPEVDLHISTWWGHLKAPDEVGDVWFNASAASGFRSSLLYLPRRGAFAGCAAYFGAEFATQAEIDENDCGYNKHLPGGTFGLLDTGGVPFLSCPRANKTDCTARLGDSLSFLSWGDILAESHVVTQTHGNPNVVATSRGNETNLKRPLRVIIGDRVVRDLDLMAYTPETNLNHPDKAALRTLFAVSEGPINSISEPKINDIYVQPQNINIRLGTLRQPATGFSSSIGNFSGTAHFYGVIIGNWTGITAQNIRGSCRVSGYNQIRVYSNPTTYTRQYTTNRAWVLLEMYTNKRWGHGLAHSRFVIQDWLDLAAWCDQIVSTKDAQGNLITGTRSTCNLDLQGGRVAQQQISDMCLWGHFGLPLHYNGKLRMIPLEKETNLAGAPVFSDYGEDRNIVRDEKTGISSLTWSQISDAELPNSLIITFEDADHLNIERPITIDDPNQQLKAGKALGDNTRRRVEKPYSAFGITSIGEAVRMGNVILDLGEFDSGGLKNNLRVKFITWYKHCLKLWKYRVIRVKSKKIERFGFDYFRVMSMRRRSDLKVEVVAQAYPQFYYDDLENVLISTERPGQPIGDNSGGLPGDPPTPPIFEGLNYKDDEINFKLSAL